jgi:hypothetical protein
MPSDVPVERLRDIVINIDRIRAHLSGTSAGKKFDAKTRDAVEREAAKKLGPMMEDRRPLIP